MLKRSTFAVLALIFVLTFSAQAAEWSFDTAHSNIGFKIKHLMITNVRGSFDTFSGKVEYDENEAAKAIIAFEIEAASVNTGNEKRDGHLKSADFFDVENYPKLTFKSSKVEKTGDGLKITGDLTIHGVTKAVVLDVEELVGPVKGPMGNTRIGATATTTIDRRDFGLTWSKTIETGGLVVDNEVKIVLEVELIKM